MLNKIKKAILEKLMKDKTKYYAILSEDGGVIALSTSDLLVKFVNGRVKVADVKDCEAIYAGQYYTDWRWMDENRTIPHICALVTEISGERFDRYFDELYGEDFDPAIDDSVAV